MRRLIALAVLALAALACTPSDGASQSPDVLGSPAAPSGPALESPSPEVASPAAS